MSNTSKKGSKKANINKGQTSLKKSLPFRFLYIYFVRCLFACISQTNIAKCTNFVRYVAIFLKLKNCCLLDNLTIKFYHD